jgi:arylsulfatase A-like enzyme
MKSLHRFSIVLTGALVTGVCAAANTPNIVLLFADDLGFADVGYNGCTDFPTPHIDSIARNGVICEQGYVCAPVCAPSRAGLLTGRYPSRFGFEDTPGPFIQSEEVEIGIPLSEKNIAERLKSLGYTTGMIGKWHEGRLPQYQPHRRGFDETFYFTDGWTHYFDQPDPLQKIKRGDDPVDLNGEYTTDAFGREAAAFIERNKDRPFFLYVPFNAPHVPMEAKPELLERFSSIDSIGRRTLAAMTYSLDENIGRILQTLETQGLTQNTLVIFLSDNGGKPSVSGKIESGGGAANFSLNLPLNGKKGQLYEGGIRVPFCMQWPTRLPAGTRYKHPVSALDLLPTIIAATENEISKDWKLDGKNLLPYINGEGSGAPHETLCWRFLFQSAIRSKDWKLVKPKDHPPELYNMAGDPDETCNVIAEHPEVAEKLQKQYDEWNAEMVPANWSWIPAYGGRIRIPADDPRRQW